MHVLVFNDQTGQIFRESVWSPAGTEIAYLFQYEGDVKLFIYWPSKSRPPTDVSITVGTPFIFSRSLWIIKVLIYCDTIIYYNILYSAYWFISCGNLVTSINRCCFVLTKCNLYLNTTNWLYACVWTKYNHPVWPCNTHAITPLFLLKEIFCLIINYCQRFLCKKSVLFLNDLRIIEDLS